MNVRNMIFVLLWLQLIKYALVIYINMKYNGTFHEWN